MGVSAEEDKDGWTWIGVSSEEDEEGWTWIGVSTEEDEDGWTWIGVSTEEDKEVWTWIGVSTEERKLCVSDQLNGNNRSLFLDIIVLSTAQAHSRHNQQECACV